MWIVNAAGTLVDSGTIRPLRKGEKYSYRSLALRVDGYGLPPIIRCKTRLAEGTAERHTDGSYMIEVRGTSLISIKRVTHRLETAIGAVDVKVSDTTCCIEVGMNKPCPHGRTAEASFEMATTDDDNPPEADASGTTA